MTPEHARELLGGLAAGILTPEERQTLFEAALHDQALFNEVAGELEMAAFLQSPETRAQLANRIEVEPARRKWWTLSSGWLALSGVLAASTVLFVVLWHRPVRVSQEFIAAAPSAALSTPPAVASDMKEPAPGASTVAPRQKLAPMAKSTASVKQKRAAIDEIAKGAQPADRPEQSTQRQAQQTLTASGTASAQRFAESMAPRAAPAPPMPKMPPPAPPPIATASLTGTVHDAAGSPVAGATVDILNTSTNTTTHATADSNGRFEASSLPQGGPYTVTADAPGFRREQQSGITLTENQPARIDIPLQVGEMAETVTVASATPPLPTNQNLGQNLTQVAVLDFVNGFGQNQSGAQAADLVSNQLGNSGQVRVIDRERVQQAAQSQNATGRPQNAQEAAALGRSIGADAVIVGSFQAAPGSIGGFARMKSKAEPNVSVTAEIIDTKQARPPVTITAGGASLKVAANALGNQIQSTLSKPAEGSVTNLKGGIVSVKFVSPPGLAVGARCDVIRGMRKIGELVITSVNGQYAFGNFSGTGKPRAGDRVTASR